MKDKGLSPLQLAKLLDIHESRVSDIILGRVKRMTVDRLMSCIELVDHKANFGIA